MKFIVAFLALMAAGFICIRFLGSELLGIMLIVLALIIAFAKILGEGFRTGKKVAKAATKDMMKDMEAAKPKPPKGEFIIKMGKDVASKIPDAMPEFEKDYSTKNLSAKMSQGSKNFFDALGKLFRK
ncbi:MAG: hypothetical protein AB1467_06015 [Candidatus Diapherotrites archaeon]